MLQLQNLVYTCTVNLEMFVVIIFFVVCGSYENTCTINVNEECENLWTRKLSLYRNFHKTKVSKFTVRVSTNPIPHYYWS